MGLGLPAFGDLDAPPFNPLLYPRRVLMAVLENFFSQTNLVNYTGAPENPFLYVPEGYETSLRSKLVIADTFSDELNQSDPRPTVVIGRGTFQFTDIATDSRRDYTTYKLLTRVSASAIGTDNRTKAKYSDITSVGVEIKCYSRRDTEVEQLAWLVAGFLKIFRQEIKDGSFIHKISSPVIGPPAVVKGDSQLDMFMVPINLLVYMPMVWAVQNSASPAIITAGMTNLSGSQFPQVLSETSPFTLEFSPQA